MGRRSYPLVVAAMFVGTLALTAFYMRACYKAGISVLEQKMEQVKEVRKSIDDQIEETECRDPAFPPCRTQLYENPFEQMDIERMFREY